MENLRKSSRVEAQHFISYDLKDEKGETVLSGMALSRDLSQKGVQMQDRTAFPQDAAIQIHIAVGNEVVDIDGRVRHIEKMEDNEYRIGIEFVHIDSAKLEKLARFYPEILSQPR
jgi:c-di-GMP-binding flagellar brake protein YcgR